MEFQPEIFDASSEDPNLISRPHALEINGSTYPRNHDKFVRMYMYVCMIMRNENGNLYSEISRLSLIFFRFKHPRSATPLCRGMSKSSHKDRISYKFTI
jgi:hypothetical protein